jgi:hypothetical protein
MKHLMGEKNIGDNTFSLAGRENELLAIVSEEKGSDPESHQCLTAWLCGKL